jgi:cell division septation protein DedD
MPPEIVQQVTTDPNALRAVKADIEAGVFDKAMREAYANMTLNGVDFNTAYINAKEVLLAQKPVVEQPRVTRGDRVRASASRGKASEPSRNIGVGTIADMSDDEFLENLNDLIASARPKN